MTEKDYSVLSDCKQSNNTPDNELSDLKKFSFIACFKVKIKYNFF
jgi:hypothetical protein